MTNYRFETQTEYDQLHAHRATLAEWHEGDKTEFQSSKDSRRVLGAALNILNHLSACMLPPLPSEPASSPDEDDSQPEPVDEPADAPSEASTSDGQSDESNDSPFGDQDGESDALDSYL